MYKNYTWYQGKFESSLKESMQEFVHLFEFLTISDFKKKSYQHL